MENQAAGVEPSSSPEQLKPLERPEQKFERRRWIMLIILAGVIVLMCQPFWGIFNPTKGLGGIVGGVPSPSPRFILQAVTPSPIFQPPVAVVVPNSATLTAGVNCHALGDVVTGAGIIPSSSKVVASGWTSARGGLVAVVAGGKESWINAASLVCDDDIRRLERSYLEPLGTPVPSVRPGSSVVRVPVVQTVIVVQTAMPAPVNYQPVLNAVWFDGQCWHLDVQQVKAIFVNGSPASGGSTMCSVNSFSVTVR